MLHFAKYGNVSNSWSNSHDHWYWCSLVGYVDLLLVFHCNYTFILYHFRDINDLPKFKDVTWPEHTKFGVIYHDQSVYRIWKVSILYRFRDIVTYLPTLKRSHDPQPTPFEGITVSLYLTESCWVVVNSTVT